jgi:hypothetical protein
VAVADRMGNVRSYHHHSHLVAWSMNATALTILRTGATIALTVLVALGNYYPSWDHWISAAVLAGAVIGIHAIPSVDQTSNPSVPPKSGIMTQLPGGYIPFNSPPENPTGLTKQSGQPFQGE